MKKIKIIMILMIMIVLTGCSNRHLIKVYNNMRASKDMNGYSVNLRIYGRANDKTFNKIIRITNYKDEKFLITEVNPSANGREREDSEDLTYVIDGTIYRKVNNEYKKVKKYKYTNPLIYLEGLKNVNKTIEKKEEKIGKNEYQVYEVQIKSEFLNKLLKEIEIEEAVTEDENATVYVNSENYVYKIIYEIKDLTVNVNYSGINKSRDIELPKAN